jgi:hypothetical protein
MSNFSAYASVASSSSASTFTLTPRYNYVVVSNLTTGTGATVIWVRTDGNAATVDGDECYALAPGQRGLFGNQAAAWTQAASVIAAGSLTHFGPNPGIYDPSLVQPFGSSLYGGTASPGTSVSIILDTGSGPVQVSVEAAG